MAAGLNKARAQSASNLVVLFKILDTAGTPTIVAVSPSAAAGDISITDTGTGIYDVTVKNFKGQQGVVNAQVTPYTTSLMASTSARSYSSDDFSITIRIEDDASSLTDSSCDVRLEAF